MFNDFIGQNFLVDKNTGVLIKMITTKKYYSFILYAPVGWGKTTLAHLFLDEIDAKYLSVNACNTSLKELKDILNNVRQYPDYWLIIDEIHRLDKQQQNLLLPYLDMNLKIIGTTSENPDRTLNQALRSRIVTFKFKPLTNEEYLAGIKHYFTITSYQVWDDQLIKMLGKITNHDIRCSYNMINMVCDNYSHDEINIELLNNLFNQQFNINYSDSYHYDLISCLQKSIRASDVNASIFYLGCLIRADDLDAIIRRLGIIAYEDVGLANSNLCAKTINALDYAQSIGLPEARIILANIVIELAISPKSRSAYSAINNVLSTIDDKDFSLPEQLTNQFKYDMEASYTHNNLPKNLQHLKFYEPNTNSRYEQALADRYQELIKMHKDDYES